MVRTMDALVLWTQMRLFPPHPLHVPAPPPPAGRVVMLDNGYIRLVAHTVALPFSPTTALVSAWRWCAFSVTHRQG